MKELLFAWRALRQPVKDIVRHVQSLRQHCPSNLRPSPLVTSGLPPRTLTLLVTSDLPPPPGGGRGGGFKTQRAIEAVTADSRSENERRSRQRPRVRAKPARFRPRVAGEARREFRPRGGRSPPGISSPSRGRSPPGISSPSRGRSPPKGPSTALRAPSPRTPPGSRPEHPPECCGPTRRRTRHRV